MRKVVSTMMGLTLAFSVAAAEVDRPARTQPGSAAGGGAARYENDFEKTEAGSVPSDMLVLDGGFAVTNAANGNKVLELPGSPLETYGVLFGPTEAAGLSVQARIQATGKGRRFPVFGVGLNGVAGFRLRVAPGKKALELYRGDDPVTSVPFNWESGTWTILRLEQVKVKEGELAVRGKAWKQGDKEPADWLIKYTANAEVPAGRPSLWGSPYAGTPIQFDDLVVRTVL